MEAAQHLLHQNDNTSSSSSSSSRSLFLVSCINNRERNAIREIQRSYESLYREQCRSHAPAAPNSMLPPSSSKANEINSEICQKESFVKLIEREIAGLRVKPMDGVKQIPIKCKNVLLFEKMNERFEFIVKLLDKIASGELNLKCVQRIFPINFVCTLSIPMITEKILKSINAFLLENYESLIKNSPNDVAIKYGIEYQKRNNQNFDSILAKTRISDSLRTLPGISMSENSKRFKLILDYKSPDFVIFLNIICNNVFVGYMKNYFALHKYNVQANVA
ncbi:MAG: hypothetical protein MHMPM18_002441 [Marteilia pararefringens]